MEKVNEEKIEQILTDIKPIKNRCENWENCHGFNFWCWRDKPEEELCKKHLIEKYYQQAEHIYTNHSTKEIKQDGDLALWMQCCCAKTSLEIKPNNFRERVYNFCEKDKRIKDRWLKILKLRYDNALTYREIGEHLGVTQSRVTQMHNNTLRMIRGAFYNTRKLINYDVKKYVAYKEMGREKWRK